MSLRTHPTGNYAFLPGIAPYSCGVIAEPGYELVYVTLLSPVPWRAGLETVAQHLADVDRPRSALCAMALRCPSPYSFTGFAQFNAEYSQAVQTWPIFVDGVNPIARTNVAPLDVKLEQPVLHAFTYSRPSRRKRRPTFVVAGAGELPEGVLARESIVALGDVSTAGLEAKATFVLNLMTQRLQGLGVLWTDVARTQIYTHHPLDHLLRDVVRVAVGPAGLQGLTWCPSQPPVAEIEFEMDVRATFDEYI